MATKKYYSHLKNHKKIKVNTINTIINESKEYNLNISKEKVSISNSNVFVKIPNLKRLNTKKSNQETLVLEINSWSVKVPEINDIKENKNHIENTWKINSNNRNARLVKNIKNEYKIYIKLDYSFYKKLFIKNSASFFCKYCYQKNIKNNNPILQIASSVKNETIEIVNENTMKTKILNDDNMKCEIIEDKIVINKDLKYKKSKIQNDKLKKIVNKKILKNENIIKEKSEELIKTDEYNNINIKSKDKDKELIQNIYNSLFLKESKIHGIGLFTNVDIKKNTYLMKYEGEIIGKCMSDKREKMYIKNGINSIYMFEVNTDMIIDATKVGNKARYINHSCNPNCVSITNILERSIIYFTKRKILKDEELTIDYNSNDVIENKTCNCGDIKCKDLKNTLENNSDIQ